LAAALKELPGGAVAVPPALDRAILADARAGFARRRRFRLAVAWAGASAAAAAAVAILVINLRFERVPTTPVATTGPHSPSGDIDGNGRVDILDAFVLSRKIDARSATAPDDFNADGAVDQKDVDAVAALAVRLPAGGVQ
jgi:hypothetical protein